MYFDNVGGPHLVAALHNMRIGGRVALCGMISQYSDDGRGQDINHLIEAVLRRVTLRGFIVRDHEDMRPEFEKTVAGWLRSGEVEALQTVTDGIEQAVDGFLGMLKGGNVGKALVRLDTYLDGVSRRPRRLNPSRRCGWRWRRPRRRTSWRRALGRPRPR